MSWSRLCERKGALIALVAAIGLLVGVASPVWADWYWIDKDPNHTLYGNLNQNAAGMPGCACGPTAAVNSFVYLEDMYPNVYGRSLVPDTMAPFGQTQAAHNLAEMTAVATTLANAQHMNTKCPGGTWDDMFMYGKQKYMESVAPNKTVYAAQTEYTWQRGGRPVSPPIPKPNWVQQNVIPTWQFLWNNLVSCEDVEILIEEGDWGHYLTLKSFDFNDANNNLVADRFWDGTQWVYECMIDYIDPCCGCVGRSWMWQTGPATQLFVEYPGYGSTLLTMAMSESPVPEPATLVLLCSFGLCLLGYGWRRRKR